MITISIDPVIFTIGALSVRWYGVFVAIGVAAVILWGWREIKRVGKLPPSSDAIIIVIAILSGLGMAKLFHVIDLWDYYSQNLTQIFSGAGLSIYGAIVGATLAFFIYSRVRHSEFGFFADLVAPGIILGQAIGRVGCTINGCCYGAEAPAGLPWSIVYTHPNSYAPLGVPLHPTQLYEIAYNLIVFAILVKLRGRLKPDGSLYLLYFTLYSAWRVGVGFLRDGTPFVFGLQQAQFIAIIILAITIPIMAMRTRWVKAEAKA